MRAIVVLVLVLGCGGTTSTTDASSSDATTDATVTDTGITDGNTSTDTGADVKDAAVEAESCAQQSPMGCTTCCITQAGGTGGFELIYYNQCLQCASCGPNVKPCGTNNSPPASGGCIQCLKLSMMQGQPWAMCQQSAQCKAFVECFAQCPTK